MIVFAVNNTFEATDGFFERDVFASGTGEYFGNEEGLGQETLDFPCTINNLLVFF